MSVLTDCISDFNAPNFRDTETRQHAVQACVRIAENCLIEGDGEENVRSVFCKRNGVRFYLTLDFRKELFQKIWKSLLISLDDYTSSLTFITYTHLLSIDNPF